MLLVISIDTEEDNWLPSRNGLTVENIREIPRFQSFVERLGLRPTYFTAYQVVRPQWAAEIIRELHAGGRAEIAAHLHPWNTPPLEEAFTPRHSMLKNLPAELQLAKLEHLTSRLTEVLGSAPTSFRAGRFGIGAATIPALVRCGYRVDSSVTPFISWESFNEGANFLGAPLHAYRLADDAGSLNTPAHEGTLLELPVSCGFSRHPFHFWSPVHRALGTPWLRPLRAAGIASRLGVVRRIMLSPDTASCGDMLLLSSRLIERGEAFLHLVMHSPTLVPGLSPFTPTAADVQRMYDAIERYVEGIARMVDICCVTVGEAAELLMPTPTAGSPELEQTSGSCSL